MNHDEKKRAKYEAFKKYKSDPTGKTCGCRKPAFTYRWGWVCKFCYDWEMSNGYGNKANRKSDCGLKPTQKKFKLS